MQIEVWDAQQVGSFCTADASCLELLGAQPQADCSSRVVGKDMQRDRDPPEERECWLVGRPVGGR